MNLLSEAVAHLHFIAIFNQIPEKVANQITKFDGKKGARKDWRMGSCQAEQFERIGFRMGELCMAL
jgi:hypothetical protein